MRSKISLLDHLNWKCVMLWLVAIFVMSAGLQSQVKANIEDGHLFAQSNFVRVENGSLYSAQLSGRLFKIDAQGTKKQIFRIPRDIRFEHVDFSVAADRFYGVTVTDLFCYRISTPKLLFKVHAEERGVILTVKGLRNGDIFLGLDEPVDGIFRKIIDRTGHIRSIRSLNPAWLEPGYGDIVAFPRQATSSIAIWDLQNGLSWFDDARKLYSWRISNERMFSFFKKRKHDQYSISSISFGRKVMLMCDYLTGDVLILTLSNGSYRTTVHTHEPMCLKLDVSPDGRSFVISNQAGQISVWSLEGKYLGKPAKPGQEACDVCFANSNSLLAVGNINGQVSLQRFH